jgi:hypothetical protein
VRILVMAMDILTVTQISALRFCDGERSFDCKRAIETLREVLTVIELSKKKI